MKSTQGWLIAVAGLTLVLTGCTAADRASDEIGTVEEGGACSSVSNCVPGLDCIEKKSARPLWKLKRHLSRPVGKSVPLTRIAARSPIPLAIPVSSFVDVRGVVSRISLVALGKPVV